MQKTPERKEKASYDLCFSLQRSRISSGLTLFRCWPEPSGGSCWSCVCWPWRWRACAAAGRPAGVWGTERCGWSPSAAGCPRTGAGCPAPSETNSPPHPDRRCPTHDTPRPEGGTYCTEWISWMEMGKKNLYSEKCVNNWRKRFHAVTLCVSYLV